MTKFQLCHEYEGTKKVLGTMSFNGKFIFELDKEFDVDSWNRHGIIPVDPVTRTIESNDLFAYINTRLPIDLREAQKEEKIEYINKSGLRTPSDKFVFEAIKK